MRLIDADALKETLFIKFGNQLPNGLIDEIDNAPTVKTYCYFCGQTEHGKIEERKTGEWIYTPNIIGLSEYEGITCSICGEDSIGDFNFCPNCGADMRGKEE